jgi:Domain of unknown function (DUF4383)
MLLRRRRTATTPDDPDVIVEHGASLAKGPAMFVGTVLVAFGLAGLLKNSSFPSFSSSFPSATQEGSRFLGFEVNGWTDYFCITAGALLLLGAAQHHVAKAMSLVVGLALAACAIIAAIDGHDVLGLAAANFWTKIGWAAAAAVLLINTMMPRRRRERVVEARTSTTPAMAADDEPAVGRGRFGRPVREREAVTDDERTTVVEREPATPPPRV